MGTCVVTDPSAVMPRAWRADLPIRLVPIDVAWPDGSTDPGDAPFASIAQRLAAERTPPTTGAPSPGTYAELIGDLLGSFDGVLIVCPSSELSGTFQSAMVGARTTGDDRVRVLDSKTAAAGQGIVAAEAARTAAGGGDLDRACERAAEIASKIHIWATLSRLDLLRRSGRIPAVAAFGAGALGLHPVIRYSGGSPAPVGVVRSAARGAERLIGAWQRTKVETRAGRAIAFHCGRADDAGAVVERIAHEAPSFDAHAVEVSAALASHTGPGLLGLAWFWEE